MNFVPQFPWVAVLVASLAGFVIGGLWYGPLFLKPWLRHSGMTVERGRQQNKALVFGLSYLLNVVIAAGLALLLAHGSAGAPGWLAGLHTGALAGLFFVVPALGVIYLFESRSFGLWAINGGYQLLLFAAMGAILGAWPR